MIKNHWFLKNAQTSYGRTITGCFYLKSLYKNIVKTGNENIEPIYYWKGCIGVLYTKAASQKCSFKYVFLKSKKKLLWISSISSKLAGCRSAASQNMKSSQVLFKNLAKILIQEWLYVFKEPVLVAASVRMNNHREPI